MDPSYNNNGMGNAAGGGNSGVPGVGNTPGVGNVPGATPNTVTNSIPVTPTASTTPGGAPVNSNTTALFGRKFSATNTPPKTPAPVITVPQPMQLNDSANKPKKGLIIGGLVAVMVLIVGLVVGLIVMKGGGGGTAASERDDFYKYANFLLNGDENGVSDLGSYDETKEYAVDVAFKNNDKDFFDKAKQLWNPFYNKVDSNEEYRLTDNIVGDVRYQNQLMDFIVRYMNTEIWTDGDLLEMYIQDGQDIVKQKIEQNYASIIETNWAPGRDYFTELFDHAKKTVDLALAYDNYGCIVNKEVNTDCVDNNSANMASESMQYRESWPEISIYNITNRAIEELVDFCFRINNDLGNKDE